VLIRGVLKGAF